MGEKSLFRSWAVLIVFIAMPHLEWKYRVYLHNDMRGAKPEILWKTCYNFCRANLLYNVVISAIMTELNVTQMQVNPP